MERRIPVFWGTALRRRPRRLGPLEFSSKPPKQPNNKTKRRLIRVSATNLKLSSWNRAPAVGRVPAVRPDEALPYLLTFWFQSAMRLVVGITGASGAIFGVRALEALRALDVETHLIMSRWSRATLLHETDYTLDQVEKLASVVHHDDNQSASISSGSFRTAGMLIAPCSMRSLASIRAGCGDTLICRTADVILKERRKLVLLAGGSPFSQIHLENMLSLTRMGTVVLPP